MQCIDCGTEFDDAKSFKCPKCGLNHTEEQIVSFWEKVLEVEINTPCEECEE